MAGILFSCVNDLDTIQKVTYDPKAPDEVTSNLYVMYNDSGYAKVQLRAGLAETFNKPHRVTKLKDGLKVDFFSYEGEVVSTLTAINGEIDSKTGLMFVKDSVVLFNHEKSQYLETEELFYNRLDSTIYTDRNVIVRTTGKGVTGRGQGIRTTQSFSKYTILKPVGKLER